MDLLGLSVFGGFERRVDSEQRTVGDFEVGNLGKGPARLGSNKPDDTMKWRVYLPVRLGRRLHFPFFRAPQLSVRFSIMTTIPVVVLCR